MRPIWLPRLAALALILYFWASGITYLDRFPPVHQDEPWTAEPGYTFWETGRFSSELFAGFYGAEQHYYAFPPLFSMFLGAGLHLFGMGLFQLRVIPLVCILLTLALTYRLGTALFSRWHGLVAVALLAGWRVAAPPSPRFSGIPLLDIARIARYDAAVPLFGLAALWLFTIAVRNPSRWKWFGVGVLAGLAMLSHLYGGFWLAALLLVVIVRLRARAFQASSMIVLGFAITLTPWLLFIASGWNDFLNQNRNYVTRFALFDPYFYVSNLSNEWKRYQPLWDTVAHSWGARGWLLLLGIGLVWLALKAVRRRHPSSRILLLSLSPMIVLFTLFSPIKTFSYLATLWPLFALVVAVAVVSLWQFTGKHVWKLLLLLLFAAMMIEGNIALQRVQAIAAQTTPYQAYTDAIMRLLPTNSRVMGLHQYWLGLAEHTANYRSFLVPINWTNPAYAAIPISFEEAVQAVAPDILLIDQQMLDLLKDVASPESPLHDLGIQINSYLRKYNAQLIGNISDRTYGQMLIYQLNPSADSQ